jgi:hypothetical protein
VSAALEQAVRALQMPPEDARAWLLRVRAFCEKHGGEPRYAALMKLIEDAVQKLAPERR